MAKTRIGWYRSVSNIPRVFATGSAVCEVAHKLGRDPKEFLLELIGEDRILDPKALGFPEDFWHYGDPVAEFPMSTARLKNAINVACEKAGWGKKLPEGQGLGLAAHIAWQSYVATVVHVAVDKDGRIRVPEVHTAMDCGFAVEQSNFTDYNVTRMSNYPKKVNVHLINGNPARPSGVGEPGLPPFHAAMANAIFAATKKRVRNMPMGEKLERA
jgi:isoquinoline 1-oxidoreductase beta subunit